MKSGDRIKYGIFTISGGLKFTEKYTEILPGTNPIADYSSFSKN